MQPPGSRNVTAECTAAVQRAAVLRGSASLVIIELGAQIRLIWQVSPHEGAVGKAVGWQGAGFESAAYWVMSRSKVVYGVLTSLAIIA